MEQIWWDVLKIVCLSDCATETRQISCLQPRSRALSGGAGRQEEARWPVSCVPARPGPGCGRLWARAGPELSQLSVLSCELTSELESWDTALSHGSHTEELQGYRHHWWRRIKTREHIWQFIRSEERGAEKSCLLSGGE